MKNITICIITYNQEDVIGRALDSLLQQKEWGLYRIVVNDDCSNDRTWAILKEYQEKYPEIVYPYRNKHNLGIYPNLEQAITHLPDSDLYSFLSGDDEYCNDYFKEVQNLIIEQKVNTDSAVGIFSDWKTVSTDKKIIVHSQNASVSGIRLWSLKARGKLTNRSLMISKKVLDNFEPILKGHGLNLTESHHDSQPFLNIKEVYYFSRITTIYYSDIGVSTKLSLSNSDYLTHQNIEKWKYGINHYVHDNCDMHYAQYQLLKSEFYLNPSLGKLLSAFYHFELGQLPGYRDSFRSTVRTFWNLAKLL